jgi:hypothetical protein
MSEQRTRGRAGRRLSDEGPSVVLRSSSSGLDLIGTALEDAAHLAIASVASIQRLLARALESFS